MGITLNRFSPNAGVFVAKWKTAVSPEAVAHQ